MNTELHPEPARLPAAPRLYMPQALPEGSELALPPGAARHAQVLRLQPGDAVTLFNGEGGECRATITRMGRSSVIAHIGPHQAIEREAPRRVHVLAGLMAGERMDWLVEKATELGAASLTPLLTRHCALRPSGPHAAKKHAHWQAVAVAACEQSGRNRLPTIHPPRALEDELEGALESTLENVPPNAQASCPAAPASASGHARFVLSLQADAIALRAACAAWPAAQTVTLLSGPEGGLSAAEQARAQAAGFVPVSLGNRVLRAETAPIAALALLLA